MIVVMVLVMLAEFFNEALVDRSVASATAQIPVQCVLDVVRLQVHVLHLPCAALASLVLIQNLRIDTHHEARCAIAALQTVGAFLVIALVVTPGATAYLITNRFSTLIILSISIGSVTSFCGSYLSYFIDGATGGVIVLLLTIVFFVAFIFKNNGNPMIWKKDKRGLLKDV